jgi:hypothetical protein
MNCKKGIGFFLAVMILVSNVGFAFTMHYCGGKVASFSVRTIDSLATVKKSCCAKKVIEKDSCCKNKTVHFEKKTDQATLKAFSFDPIAFYLTAEFKQHITVYQNSFKSNPTTTYYCDAHAPPLFKLYHHYIFYA